MSIISESSKAPAQETLMSEGAAQTGQALEGAENPALAPSTSDIPDTATETRADDLSQAEKAYVENRPQRLASDLLEQKHKLQGTIFHIALVIICTFYLFFLLTVMGVVCSQGHELYKFPATITVLIAMLGSIPTILMAFLMSGLFREKDAKDKEKDEKSAIDMGVLAKVIFEVAKASKH